MWVRSRLGIEMTAEYTVVDRPRVVALRMVCAGGGGRREASRVFERFEGEWRFEEDDGRTAATMRCTYTLWRRWCWMGGVVGGVLSREVLARVEALGRAVEGQGSCDHC